MTSAEIRQSFLDFFKSKGHTIVPSSSLLPASPNLLFTNAGMNQFVPIFLGQQAPDISKWPGAIPGSDTRAADTQKCIRAGGKHNDLEDVGLDTYHLTFFEMLGNWSFGDYFKRESLSWGWELLTRVWGIPAKRLFATVYAPDKSQGDPAEFDQEASDIWTEIFQKEGLDSKVHIIHGNKKDNFWMMGETGPCGPCSEIHFNLLPSDDEQAARALVNSSSQRCIEIWNHVFIQFNANPDGTFSQLPAKHVDTGMGFDRIAGFYAGTKKFTDFSELPSAYNTDIFTSLFTALEKLSGKKYTGSLPKPGGTGDTEQEKIDIAFRVIADHIRTLSFAIADGIQPGNTDRGYVLRRILRRAVRYGRTLGFHQPFFYKLVNFVADNMGHVFPEIRSRQDHVEEVIQREEEAFNKTLDRGIELFEEAVQAIREIGPVFPVGSMRPPGPSQAGKMEVFPDGRSTPTIYGSPKRISGEIAFKLYDTYGFPLDLTELMARERGFTVDIVRFNELMDEQKARGRAAQKKTVIELSQVETTLPTQFIGYEKLETTARVLDVVTIKDATAIIFNASPFYAEMGGQVGDSGSLSAGSQLWRITNTQKAGNAWLHLLEANGGESTAGLPNIGSEVIVAVDRFRRNAIQRHHTVTHLLHWALHELVSKEASQKGSYVGPEKLTFDFNGAPLTPQQIADVEKLVNECILENAAVSCAEVPYSEVKLRKDIMQFFGEKYGDKVRVVQIGGKPTALDGYSMELCGGTHTRATGEIGLFRIVAESAIAAGVRRIEAVSGFEAYKQATEQLQVIKSVAGKLNAPVGEIEKKIEALLSQQKELEKQLKTANQKQAAETARTLIGKAKNFGTVSAIIENMGSADGDILQAIADSLKGQFKGVVVLGGASNGSVALLATVSPELHKQFQAGKIIQTIAPIVGGKGGGRLDNARGGGKDVSKLEEALGKARSLLS
jgi:alanyl-tRNA synthetase